jgi:hypothetical protein
MKAYWGVELYLHAFLTLALDGSKWSASCPSHLTPRERAHILKTTYYLVDSSLLTLLRATENQESGLYNSLNSLLTCN